VNAAPSDVDRRIASFREAVKASGVKLTHQRLEIFREVAASLDHPDADSIFREVRRRVPTVSLDTVYRTLWLLNDLGLITTLGPRRESVRFDANLAHHHHYVCVQCGLARDFESAELNALHLPDAVKRLGSISGTHVEVRGVCERCMKRAPRSPQPASSGRKRGRGVSVRQGTRGSGAPRQGAGRKTEGRRRGVRHVGDRGHPFHKRRGILGARQVIPAPASGRSKR